MALYSDAAMVMYYDITGDNADHDDWHTYEHMYERLAIPGFTRATRWVARAGAPRYMVIYEVSGPEIAASPDYLARLNAPTPWTQSMMGRFRNMIRGACRVAASAGFGFGTAAVSVRFTPANGEDAAVTERLAREVLPAMASRRGMTSVHLLQPAAAPPVTQEQALRGAPDTAMTWVLLATAYDPDALSRAIAEHLQPEALARLGMAPGFAIGTYALHYTATGREATRTPPNPPLRPELRPAAGIRQ